MIITLAKEEVELRPERALFWPRERLLFIADCHFGKADTFRRLGVPIPRQPNAATLQRLNAVIQAVSPEKLIILGDFWHDAQGPAEEDYQLIHQWRKTYPDLLIDVVLGNHDRRAIRLFHELNMAASLQPLQFGPFVASHAPIRQKELYCLAGHLHPGYVLRGRARESLSLPCFWFGSCLGVLPSFGSFTGNAPINPKPGDRVVVIAGQEVIDISATCEPTMKLVRKENIQPRKK